MATKIIKRTRTWKTKSGQTRKRTYYYEVTPKGTTRTTKKGKQTKQTFKSITSKRKATLNTVDKVKQYLQDKSISLGSEHAQIILNEARAGKTFTTQQIDERLKRQPWERGKRDVNSLLRALGYSKDEFINELGITESDFDSGTFEKIGNDILFTSALGVVRLFQWDYDAGFTESL